VTISVIMTVYDDEDYVEQAIESVLAQEGVNYELIIVNDGSTDSTPELLNKYEKFNHVRVFHMPRMGRGGALNYAISKAKGEYIANLDSDDLFHPEKLKMQLLAMQGNPEIGVLSTEVVYFTDNDFTWEDYEHCESVCSHYIVTPKLVLQNVVVHSSVLIKKKALTEASSYDEKRSTQLDYDLWIRIAGRGWEIARISKPLTAKRMHKSQFFERKKRISYLLSSISLQKKAIRMLKKPKYYYLLCYARLLYGLMPRFIRETIKERQL